MHLAELTSLAQETVSSMIMKRVFQQAARRENLSSLEQILLSMRDCQGVPAIPAGELAGEGNDVIHGTVCRFSPSCHRALQALGESDKRLPDRAPGRAS